MDDQTKQTDLTVREYYDDNQILLDKGNIVPVELGDFMLIDIEKYCSGDRKGTSYDTDETFIKKRSDGKLLFAYNVVSHFVGGKNIKSLRNMSCSGDDSDKVIKEVINEIMDDHINSWNASGSPATFFEI